MALEGFCRVGCRAGNNPDVGLRVLRVSLEPLVGEQCPMYGLGLGQD